MRNVNEPDPIHFDSEIVVRNLKARGVNARVDKLRYVYLDVYGYIFEGNIESVNSDEWKELTGFWISKYRGVLIKKKKGPLTMVGFCDCKNLMNLESHFATRWNEITK